ncbi:MAG: FliA/WhiG family RNA polymerase sigma factor, partial [Actinobacteria bacterium]|nr:FliA/WhiG family RNA polymerase sigma factor [Actinomycetota bacterium]
MIMEVNLAILWKSYKQNEDTYFRDRLISNYRPFLKSVVNHVHSRLPRTVDVMDLENYAYIGLLDAIKKFDLGRNIKFETYASYRIKGAIIE